MQGTVKFFDETRGFGFIVDAEGNERFVHATALDGQEIKKGDEVSFDLKETPRGQAAVNVQLL